ncbi:hypothetical protein BG006_005967 [Podila minutissima]|uniref:MICOS complex subunit n=1 Tax=Podila minutissima TaxID=64525 RepID=A0A9P5SLW6_9FUNG|nr:hypothetical protein BG006_005967 [Podila minutissima]
MNENEYRRMRAHQEPMLPGLAFAGAAAVGGSILVNRSRSFPVKVLTPLAFGAVTGAYFLPAHISLIRNIWSKPTRVSTSTDTSSESLRDLKRSAEAASLDVGHKTMETVNDVSRQAQNSGQDIKGKAENLAENYHEVGQDQINKAVEKSAHEARGWLDQQKTEAGGILNDTSAILSTTKPPSSSFTPAQMEHNKFHNFESSSSASQEQPSSSRWSWWTSSDSVAPKKDVEGKIHDNTTTTTTHRVERPRETTATTTITAESKPHKIVVDKAVARSAVKQHDVTINRGAMLGKEDIEETARKVHENVVDAALPKARQSRNEEHPIEISRRASESGLQDGKYIVGKLSTDPDAPYQRVGKAASKKDTHHGLQNLEKRAHMLYDGVEHLEHKIDQRIQKSLQEEADFWHEQSLKEEANARARERGV